MDTRNNRESVLFLYLPTGGGHISAARALADEIRKTAHAPTTDIHILDPLADSPAFIQTMVEDGYTKAAVQFPFLWPMLYQSSSYGLVMALQTRIMSLLCRMPIARQIRQHGVTRIVVLHFLLIRPVQEALELLGCPQIPVLTAVLDPFTLHPLWAYRLRGPVCVFSPEARHRMVRLLARHGHRGSPERRGQVDIRVVPPLIRSDFLTPLPAERNHENRRDQGLDPKKKTILLAGGGDGLPGGERLLTALCRAIGTRQLADVQIVMVCGKNELQYHQSKAISDEYPDVPVLVLGYTRIMYELMNLSDLIIAKGGPATVFEALALDKPLFISSYFYGQEKGNVDFVVRHGLGHYDRSARRMAGRALDWLHGHRPVLANSDAGRQIRQNMLNRSGARDIVQILFELPARPVHHG